MYAFRCKLNRPATKRKKGKKDRKIKKTTVSCYCKADAAEAAAQPPPWASPQHLYNSEWTFCVHSGIDGTSQAWRLAARDARSSGERQSHHHLAKDLVSRGALLPLMGARICLHAIQHSAALRLDDTQTSIHLCFFLCFFSWIFFITQYKNCL